VNIMLGDLRQAVRNYLMTKVTVSVSDLVRSTEGYEFTFTVTAANASEGNGGIGLTNMRYQVQVKANGQVSLRVPGGGSSIGAHGESLGTGSWVEFFNFNPSDANLSYLQIGGSNSLTFTGLAAGPPWPVSVDLTASFQADPDINSVFPRNLNSSKDERTYSLPLTS